MIQDGSIREIYFREERSEAVIILEAADTPAGAVKMSG